MMATKKRIISVVAISLMFMMMISASASVGPLFAHAAGPATFGNTVVGPYTDRTPIGDKDSVMYQAPETGIMTSISMYIQTSGALVRYAVYTDLNGQPDRLIAQSQIVVTRGNDWTTALIYAPIEAGQNYWLTVASNTLIYWNYDFGALAGNGKQSTAISSLAYGEFIPWGTAKFSMYATYIPTDSAAPAEVVPPAPVQTPAPVQEPVAPAPAVTTPEPAPEPTPAPVQASPAPTSNLPAGLTVKAQTDFETVTKTSSATLSLDFKHSFHTEGTGGASMWIEGLDRSSGVPAHSGSRALGMEVTDISQSRRNEFNIYSNDIGLSNQFYVSTYVYLPSDFTLRGGDGAYMDLFQVASNTGHACPMYSLMISSPSSDGTFGMSIFARDSSASKMGNDGIIASAGRVNLPRGQWFHFEYYQVNSANGLIKVWINGQQIIDYTGNTELIGNYFLSTDLYYNADDTTQHQMWLDDFAVYG